MEINLRNRKVKGILLIIITIFIRSHYHRVITSQFMLRLYIKSVVIVIIQIVMPKSYKNVYPFIILIKNIYKSFSTYCFVKNYW